MHTNGVSVVWSDFGGVLTPPISETFQSFIARTGMDGNALLTAMHNVASALSLPLMAPLDTGLLTEAEWGRRVAGELQRLVGKRYDLTRFRDLWFADRPTNWTMVEYLRDLKRRGLRVGLLTNNVKEWEPYWRAMVPVTELFDAVVNSCEVGHRKPDAEIFTFAESTLGVVPAQCLLIDDLAENCDAAASAGWRTVLFQSNMQAMADVDQLLVQQTKPVGSLR